MSAPDHVSAPHNGVQFGTAGIRGPLGDGPGEINARLMRQIGAGLAAHLHAGAPPGHAPRAVVGYDARHGSEEFSTAAAEALAGAGVHTSVLPGPVPTPVLAFAVRDLACDLGIMITASHNPAGDSGAKVYGADGIQILPDVADRVSAAIIAVKDPDRAARRAPERLDGAVLTRYIETIVRATDLGPLGAPVSVVYTPIHGVGLAPLSRAFARAGFPPPQPVSSQAEPDPDFPTAPRPNPERVDVLATAIEQARSEGADLVLATDPDADRLAVAVPWPDHPGGWRALSGDEIGILLADRLLSGPPRAGDLVVTTIVSSSLLGRLARARGVAYVETLTGFKWIMHAARPGEQRLRFGYEEALGFAVTDAVGDKDGISAALVMTRIASELALRGSSLRGRLDELACEFGLHATAQRTVELPRSEDADVQVSAAFEALRHRLPGRLAGLSVQAVDDLERGLRTTSEGARTTLEGPRTRALQVRGESGLRVAVRPSGTEPTLKVYLEVVSEVENADVTAARARAGALLTRIGEQIVEVIGA